MFVHTDLELDKMMLDLGIDDSNYQEELDQLDKELKEQDDINHPINDKKFTGDK